MTKRRQALLGEHGRSVPTGPWWICDVKRLSPAATATACAFSSFGLTAKAAPENQDKQSHVLAPLAQRARAAFDPNRHRRPSTPSAAAGRATARGTVVKEQRFAGERHRIQTLAAYVGLGMVRDASKAC